MARMASEIMDVYMARRDTRLVANGRKIIHDSYYGTMNYYECILRFFAIFHF